MQQITEGLAAGERVIVDGVQKARPGTEGGGEGKPAEGVAAQKEPAKQGPG